MKKRYLSLIMSAACLTFAVSSVSAYTVDVDGIKAGTVKAADIVKKDGEDGLKKAIEILKSDKLFKELSENKIENIGFRNNLLDFFVDSLVTFYSSEVNGFEETFDKSFVELFKLAHLKLWVDHLNPDKTEKEKEKCFEWRLQTRTLKFMLNIPAYTEKLENPGLKINVVEQWLEIMSDFCRVEFMTGKKKS
jgi:hypothetical protein